jgi:PTS system mannose-specific IID component
VARANLPTRGARLRAVAAGCAGGLAAWLAASFGANAGGRFAPLLSVGCLGMGVLSYLLVARRVPNYVVLYLAAGLACAAGAFL